MILIPLTCSPITDCTEEVKTWAKASGAVHPMVGTVEHRSSLGCPQVPCCDTPQKLNGCWPSQSLQGLTSRRMYKGLSSS